MRPLLYGSGSATIGYRGGMFSEPGGSSPAGIDTSKCVLWVRSDLGLTKNGSNLISGLVDQSPIGNVGSASGTARPLWVASQLNGYPAIRFNGTSNVLTLASQVVLANTMTFFAVAKVGNPESNGPILGGTGFYVAPGTNTGFGENEDSGYDFIQFPEGLFSLPYAANSWNAIVGTTSLSGTTLTQKLWQNSYGPDTNTSTLSASNFTMIRIGYGGSLGGYPTALQYYLGDLIEAGAWSEALTNTQVTSLLSYLRTRYAIW
jgi:hypothetical protein